MSTFGPLDHYPGVLERKPGLIEVTVPMRDRPSASGATLVGSWHFHHLYGPRTASAMGAAAPAADAAQKWFMLTASSPPDGTARNNYVVSSSFMSGRLHHGLSTEVTRGALRFILDLNDFPTISGGKKVLPADDQMLFVSLLQIRPSLTVGALGFRQPFVQGAVDNGDPILGPILPVPPAGWWTITEPTLILAGEAPATGAGAVAMGAASNFPAPDLDLQIPNPLHFVLPRPTTSINIRNTEAGGGATLRVSHGLGAQIYEIAPGAERTYFGAVKEICLMSAAAGATCSFAIEANINLGGAAGGV